MLITCTRALSEPQQTVDPFERTWERTDRPVASGDVSRTWMWGPEAFTDQIPEPYLDASGGERQVQYYDKSRMELNDPTGDAGSVWHVTNGLLVVEMMTGQMQLGDNEFEPRQPAQINVAGDTNDSAGPTYATLATVADEQPFNADSVITATLARDGGIGASSAAAQHGVTAGPLIPETNHRVASVFWEFMNSEGQVYEDGGTNTAKLFENPFYATGFPLAEAYWSTIEVEGVLQDVLVQAFQRRVLTFTPGNEPGWQVEAGNVGQHYYAWRYENSGLAQVTVTTAAGEIPLFVEVADTSDLRRCGLMHRFSMPQNQGMLFVHTEDVSGGFWNRNTEIPLQLAWISEDGTILELTDMVAADRSSPDYPITYDPSVSYRYVIEANQGWFTNNGVEVGDQIDLSEALARGSSDAPSLCETLGYDERVP
jgi:uncharacterized membrane protein (UPF0127 family)